MTLKEEISCLLDTCWAGREIVYEERTGSTNDRAGELARRGAPEGTLVIADAQDAGRGRRGRIWISPPGAGLFMSVILRPDTEPSRISMVTLAAAMAVREGIRKASGLETLIKWPNDIVAHGKKICGILTEMHMEKGAAAYVVTGIGVNVNAETFPAALSERASSVYLETGRKVSRAEIAAAVCGELEDVYEIFRRTWDLSELRDQYNNWLVSRGRRVRVLASKGSWEGEAEGIDRMGRLLVRRTDGKLERVVSGEVSVRGVYGYV